MPSIPFGPLAFVANVRRTSPASPATGALALATTDTFIQATLDCAALAAGIHREAEIEYRRSNAGSRVATGSNDGNSAVISSPDAAFVSGDVGSFVRGGGIPEPDPTGAGGTTILSVDSPTRVTVSQIIPLGGVGYVLTVGDPWISLGKSVGSTIGGPDLGRHGNVIEWGVGPTNLPDVGTAGRQVRAAAMFGANVSVSGHATSG